MAEPQTCSVHPDRPATYRCDGCQRALCDDCVQMSHRLILCSVCGEMAIPLATGRATSTTVARRTQAREQPYSLLQALTYPLRGKGSGVFWSYVAILVAFSVLSVVPLVGCLILVPMLFVALLVPRLLFTIVRATAAGDNELPEWPEFELWGRLVDFLAYLLILAVAWFPGVVLLIASGHAEELVRAGEPTTGSASGWLIYAVCFLLSQALLIPTFGAPSVFDSFWLLPRVDLHLRALFVAPGEAAIIACVLGGMALFCFELEFAFHVVPWLGAVGSVALAIYQQFVGAHLVGLYFRHHAERLERLYVG